MAKAKVKVSRKPKAPEGYVSIKEATVLLGFKYDQYTRRLLLEDKLSGEKKAYKGFSKWWISLSSIETYKTTSRRVEAGRRFILKIDLDKEAEVRAALESICGKDGFTLSLSYKPKTEEAETEAE